MKLTVLKRLESEIAIIDVSSCDDRSKEGKIKALKIVEKEIDRAYYEHGSDLVKAVEKCLIVG